MNNLEAEQPLIYRTLDNMVKRAHVPHALIFSGDKSTSKKEMAIEFIKMMYASFYNTTIEEIPNLKRIENNSSLNVIWIKKDKKTVVSIDSIKEHIKGANESSLEEGPRFFIFEEADDLNESSSNAILKFVEEPQKDIYIIFLVENLANILDTIKSRCSILVFRPLSKEFLKDRLDLKGYDASITRVLIEYTQNENLIDKIIGDEETMQVYNMVSEMFREKFEFNESMIMSLYEHYDLLKDDLKMDLFLSLFIIYLRDMFNYATYKNEEKIVFSTEKGRIKVLSTYFSKNDLSSYLKETLEIKSNVENKKSINLHLYLDNLLLKMELKARG